MLNNLILKMIIKDKNWVGDSVYTKTSDYIFKENKDKNDIRHLSIKKLVVVFLIQKSIQLKENNKKLVKKILLFNKKIIHLKTV